MELSSIEDLEQWKLLLVVSPLFASEIAWRPLLETNPRSAAALSNSHRELLRESLRESASLFKLCIQEIPAYVPSNYVFSESTYYPFLLQINHLLEILEQLVGDLVLRGNQKSPNARASDVEEKFPKLASLGRLITSSVSAEPPTVYSQFLNLEQRVSNFKMARYQVETFNNTTRNLFSDSELVQDDPPTTTRPASKLRNRFDRSICDQSHHLFDSLATHMVPCTAKAQHRAMLHLKSPRISEMWVNGRCLELCMLLESCPDQTKWQHTQCTVPLKRDIPTSHSPDSPIHSICLDVRNYTARQIFAIELCGDTFLNVSASVFDQQPKHPAATPKISLSDLLDRGILKDRYRFFPNDRKILAYTLSQALLNFYRGPWLQNLWTLDNIFFLYDSIADKIYNIHHPYVSCILSQEIPPLGTLDSQHGEPLILSFAKLLVELERGERVTAEGGSDEPDFLSPLWRLCKDWSRDHLDHRYAKALDACVNFPKYFRADRKESFDAGETSEPTIHDTILTHIVTPLRETIDSSRASEWGLRDIDLNARATTLDGQSATHCSSSPQAADLFSSEGTPSNSLEKEPMRWNGSGMDTAIVPSGRFRTSSIPRWHASGQAQGKTANSPTFSQKPTNNLMKPRSISSHPLRQSHSNFSAPEAPARRESASSVMLGVSIGQGRIQREPSIQRHTTRSRRIESNWVSRVASESALSPNAIGKLPATGSTSKKIVKGSGIPRLQALSTHQLVEAHQSEKTERYEEIRATPTLFDVRPDTASGDIISRWEAWLANFQHFRKQILPHPVDPDTQQRIRVTVIDTGIDKSHPYIARHWSCNDENSATGYLFRDFVAADQGHEHTPVDEDGHGTFIAGILLQVAPHIELSIARIGATRKSIEKDAQIDHKIGSAIKYAVDTWRTNIVSLSFGSEEMLSYETRNALNEAERKNIIVLAAAGNAGNQGSIPYPASKQGVFKVFAVDTFGKWASFTTPPPKDHRSESFFTLGCGIVSAWPPSLREQAESNRLELLCYTEGHQCSDNRCGDRCDTRTVMSGSSFATPIAAALVALIYQFYDENESQLILPDESKMNLKTREAVHAIFNKMSISSSDLPYKYLNPLRGEDDYFKFGSFESRKRQTYIQFFSEKLSEVLFRAKI